MRTRTRTRMLGQSLIYSPQPLPIHSTPYRRFEGVASEEEAEAEKTTKRPRESNATEQDAFTEKLSKKAAKKLKAENGAAVPAPVPTPAPTGTPGEIPPKSKKDKKAKKGGDAKESHPKAGEEKGSGPTQKQGDKAGMRELPGGLKIQDAKLGEGPEAKKGTKVFMQYVGKLADGKIFDSNTKGKPVSFLSFPLYLLGKGSCDRLFDSSCSGWGLVK